MSIRNMLQRQPGQDKGDVPALVDGDVHLPTDTGRPTRVGLWALGVGFGGFLLWAGLAPLDEGVPTQGMVTIDTKRKAVQHLTGGIVREVNVREGQPVQEGQVLVKLDDSVSKANFESVRQHYLGVRAMEGRLMAEQAGQSRISFHPDLIKAAENPLAIQHMATQEQLFQSRRMALDADLRAIEESIMGQEASIQGYEGVLSNRKRQLALIQEELNGIRDLVKEGYAPRNKQMELERAMADIQASISDVQGNMMRARRAISEMRMRALQHKQEYRKEVDTQLAEVRREVQADAEKFKAAGEELGRTEIRAPASGQVVGLAVQTVGGVIQPSQKLMDIVPGNEALLLEAKVAPHLIDRVHAGLEADVRFNSFAHSPQLVVTGKVESVSGDLLTEPQTNMPYYLTRVSITPEGMKELGSRQMQPGMPAEVVIKTGERSVLTYLLHPLLKRMAASMKEE